MFKTLASKGLQFADGIALALAGQAGATSGALVTVLFHCLCRERGPQQDANLHATVQEFRAFVGAMLEAGSTAVTPAQVDAGLPRGGRHMMITFDDGYFNNTLALPVLEAFQAPATFFVSSGPVLERKAFWWDALRHELSKAGVSAREQQAEIRALKALTPGRIDEYLATRFGASSLQPHSDLDRPLTPGELKDFARSRWVHVGNHTRDHAILTNCDAQEVERQVRDCQQALQDMTGRAPIAIAYPNGNFSPAIAKAAQAAGLRLGFTVLPHRDKFPLAQRSRMTLGRFSFEAGQDPGAQCRKLAAGFVPSHVVKNLIHSHSRGARAPAGSHRHA
jgi:peptidoglycan/xylan/chitin deacetylase (PgdA/CDA1 family)